MTEAKHSKNSNSEELLVAATTTNNNIKKHTPWIRGVNLGGWLVLERFITPFQFAITDCHVEQGKLCWYPGALSAPASAPRCNLQKCQPYINFNPALNITDYPVDEWNLAAAFENHTDAGLEWFNTHFQHFITMDHLKEAKHAGVTHLRVPLPHWILGNTRSNEPWIIGDRWKYFLRLVRWCRELGLEVWPNLHTAPGSQNGFDNSGVMNSVYTCGGWGENPTNVNRTLTVLDEITRQLKKDKTLDVVTGFGLLNEPFGDCNLDVYKQFLEDALDIARTNMHSDTAIFVSDRFGAEKFNNGTWWLDPQRYHDTYLDTHFYHAFDPHTRAKSPKEHIALTCWSDDPQGNMDTCCYEEPANTTKNVTTATSPARIPSRGVQRISTEWSAAFDSMPGELLQVVMKGIAANGTAPSMYRTMEADRVDFLRDFVIAQMSSYESAPGSRGWFYWTLQMEGGAFGEWDFLRGVREGWIPAPLAAPDKTTAQLYGSCQDVLDRVNDTMSVVHPFPYGDEDYWKQWDTTPPSSSQGSIAKAHNSGATLLHNALWMAMIAVWVFLLSRIWMRRRRSDYTSIPDQTLKV